ncbi:peroxiredoxin-like family protein [Neobacillus sp. Marseille-QA0830]
MAKLMVNDKMPNFEVDTVFKRNIQLSDLATADRTILLFLRYEGCTLCRFDMRNLNKEYHKIEAAGAKAFVVLQSDPDKLAQQITSDTHPYDIICDPDQTLYKELDIRPANSQQEMIGPDTMEKLKKVQESGLVHGDYEGNEMQLPAAFIIDKNMTVLYEHYATNITDMPSVDELANLL